MAPVRGRVAAIPGVAVAVNFCINCRWHKPRAVFAECHHPALPRRIETDPVDGVTAELPHHCISERQPHRACGPDAKLFEPKDGGRVGFV